MKKINQPQCSVRQYDNFFSKLVGGGYGLPITFWGFGFFGNLLMKAFSLKILSLNQPGVSPLEALIYFAFLIIWTLYQFGTWVGIWKSSSKHNGKKLWAILARATVVLFVALVLVYLFVLLYGILSL